jgi:hypothetical protein
MNGSLVPVRAVFISIAGFILIAFFAGFISYDSKQQGCQYGKSWVKNGWVTVFSIRNVEFRLHPYGCPVSEQYDKSQFQKANNGLYPPGVVPPAN